jgi:hypothetical protein
MLFLSGYVPGCLAPGLYFCANQFYYRLFLVLVYVQLAGSNEGLKLKYVSFLVFDVALRFNLTCIIVTATVLALISAAIIQQAARAQTSTIPGVLPEEQQQQEPQTQQQAASNVTTEFLTYENPDYDLKIRYPSNWNVKEYPNSIFFSDALSASPNKAHLNIETKPAEKVLDPGDLQTKFKTAQQYAIEKITLLTGPYSLGGYKFFRNESSAIAGNLTHYHFILML